MKAITVHGRTRAQFYAGAADWAAVAEVKAAIRMPVAVNGDIVDAPTAREALARSGADAVMIGRGLYGRPWIAAAIDAALAGGTPAVEPDGEARLAIVIDHLRDSLAFYGEALGLKVFRKHLGWYVQRAPWPACPDARRQAKSELCRLETVAEIERRLAQLWRIEAIAQAA